MDSFFWLPFNRHSSNLLIVVLDLCLVGHLEARSKALRRNTMRIQGMNKSLATTPTRMTMITTRTRRIATQMGRSLVQRAIKMCLAMISTWMRMHNVHITH